MKKNCKKTNQEEFRMEKVITKKKTSYMSNGKDMIICLIVGLIKRMLLNEILLYKNELAFS